MKTVLEVIKATVPYFEKNGIESPRLNAEHLLAHALGLKRMDLYLQFDRPLEEKELEPLRELVRRRASGEPLQHLLGTIEFLGRTFRCDKRALIPRHETEQLCELIFERYKPEPFKGRALDVGVGSGVIALSLAAHFPEAAVEGIDVAEPALELARENSTRLGYGDRVKLYASDLFANVEGEFQLIVANLPYIAAGEIPGLAREVHHDPRSALNGGNEGSELILRFIAEAGRHLRGLAALEIGHDQAEAATAAFQRHHYHDIQVTSDYQGRNRFVFATHG